MIEGRLLIPFPRFAHVGQFHTQGIERLQLLRRRGRKLLGGGFKRRS
jgi:hypothetical protein